MYAILNAINEICLIFFKSQHIYWTNEDTKKNNDKSNELCSTEMNLYMCVCVLSQNR